MTIKTSVVFSELLSFCLMVHHHKPGVSCGKIALLWSSRSQRRFVLHVIHASACQLCLLQLTMDRPLPDLTRVFAYGQSVVVKVIEVKEDKGRFLCSLRMCDCYHDDPKVSLEMLETYLNERDQYLDSMLDYKGVFSDLEDFASRLATN